MERWSNKVTHRKEEIGLYRFLGSVIGRESRVAPWKRKGHLVLPWYCKCITGSFNVSQYFSNKYRYLYHLRDQSFWIRMCKMVMREVRSGHIIWPHSQGQHVRSGQEKWRKNRLARMISNIYTVVLVKNEWEWMRMNENEWEWMRSENEWMKEREWMDGWMDITRLPVIFIFYLFVLQTYFELSLNFLNRLFAISFCIN